MVAGMDIDDVLDPFGAQVSIPDPALDQAFAAARQAFQSVGIGGITAVEARKILSTLMLYLGAPEETRIVISSYLGSLLERPPAD